MKKSFALNSILFALPLVALGLWLELKARSVPTSYSIKAELIEAVAGAVEVLVFGTSHAFYDLNPEVFSAPGFNMANTSQSLVLDAELFERYLERMPKLKVVVLGLSYFSFEYRLYGQVDDFREYFYPRFYQIRGDGGWWSLFDLRTVSQLATFGPQVMRDILLNRFHENHAPAVSARGWFDSAKAQERRLPISDEAGRNRAEYHSSVMRERNLNENLAAIKSVVEKARARGVHVVMTRFPANVTYTRYLDAKALERFNSDVAKTGLNFFDHLRDSRFQSSDFYDNDHLNPEAASRFSRIFDREALVPLLVQGR